MALTVVGHPIECRCDACADAAIRRIKVILAQVSESIAAEKTRLERLRFERMSRWRKTPLTADGSGK